LVLFHLLSKNVLLRQSLWFLRQVEPLLFQFRLRRRTGWKIYGLAAHLRWHCWHLVGLLRLQLRCLAGRDIILLSTDIIWHPLVSLCVVLQCRDETHAGRDAAGQIRALALAVVLVGLQSFGIDHGLARDWIALLAQVLHQRIGLGSLVRSVPEMLDRAGDAVGGVGESLEQVIAPAITGWTNCEWHCVSPPPLLPTSDFRLLTCRYNQAKFPCAS